MPARMKKRSNTLLKLSHSNQHTSPDTAPSPTQNHDSELSEDDILYALEEASSRYPSLIGKSAFAGRITDVVPESKGCKIWLSEPSMVSFSLFPGSTASISLALKSFSNGTPLCSLAEACSGSHGVDAENKTSNEAGNHFVLATIFPSCKVSKNGVLLSLDLAHSLGLPASGKVAFVYPVKIQSLGCSINKSGWSDDPTVNCLSLHNCKELHLKLVPLKDGSTSKNSMSPPIRISSNRGHDDRENGTVSSPRSPLSYRSKLDSLNTIKFASPVSGDSMRRSSNPNNISCDSLDIEEVLENEGAQNLLQTGAVSWLHSRSLLCGNLVTIPILSKHYVFRVIGGVELFEDDCSEALKGVRGHNSGPQTLKSYIRTDCGFTVNHKTKVHLFSTLKSASETLLETRFPCGKLEDHTFKADEGCQMSKLGGLSNEYKILKDIIMSSLVKNTLRSLDLQPTKGVLLHGPPGTGKTSLARLCARDAGASLFLVNGPEVISQYYGESEQALHEVFHSASRSAPAVVFIDELDAIAPARQAVTEELSQRMVATLLNLMDGITRAEEVLVLAATNRLDSIEPALRRPGRFEREIEIGVPSPKQRLEILSTLLCELQHSLSNAQIEHLAMVTHGFVGADIATLCSEAALVCLRKYIKLDKPLDKWASSRSILYDSSNCVEADCSSLRDSGDKCERVHSNGTSPIISGHVSSKYMPSSNLSAMAAESNDSICNEVVEVSTRADHVKEELLLKVGFEDFEKARLKVRPSAMREVILEVPKVKWEDVGGQKEVKAQLMEAVEWPQKYAHAFKSIGVRPPKGVLMFGPPGCSKTLLARAVASEAGLNFFAVKGPELFSKWVGESEKAVRSLFAKARANAPSIIFFDEIDGLAVTRGEESDGVSVADRVMSQLLVELDGLHQRGNVTVIAATNRPDKIDPALLRQGRFDRQLYVGPPNESDREEVFRIHLRRIPCSSDVSIKELATQTEGYSGADISLICREAAVAAIEENLEASEVKMKHLRAALERVRPSDLQYHELPEKFQTLINSGAKIERSAHQPSSTKSWSLVESFKQLFYQFLPRPNKSLSG